ncbi:hypothetical protein ECC40_07420 [Helicobacter pylori]|uniref:hypothetical protein n=1 Tax=Helicobacter pylori TaxID=210 RepID=UPI000FDD39D7|nr:hypothetical protein [Helicobacter pylori]RVY74078.1 hypothetical protein ECC40_07420 [Helicobacter pylori]
MRKVFVFNEGLIIKSKKCAKAFLKSIIKSLQKASGNFLKIKNNVCQYPMKTKSKSFAKSLCCL